MITTQQFFLWLNNQRCNSFAYAAAISISFNEKKIIVCGNVLLELIINSLKCDPKIPLHNGNSDQANQ